MTSKLIRRFWILMKKNKTVSYLFKGYVQGVGFRSFCHYHATKFDVSGHVRNLSNGDVSIIACAPEINLSLFYEKIQKGPPGSNVSDVIIEELHNIPVGKGFKIL